MQLQDSLRDIQPQSQTSGIVMLLQFEHVKHIRQIVRLDFPPGIGDIDLDPRLGTADTDADHPAGIDLSAFNSKFQLCSPAISSVQL